MAFRKPITTLGGNFWWSNIEQNMYFILQKHNVGFPLWPYRYRILMRENQMEIANSNDYQEIQMDWKYLESNAVPQLDKKIDLGDINLSTVIRLISKLL